jgi:hypothetical protein
MDAAKDIHKEMLPIWAAFLCGYPLWICPQNFIASNFRRLASLSNNISVYPAQLRVNN